MVVQNTSNRPQVPSMQFGECLGPRCHLQICNSSGLSEQSMELSPLGLLAGRCGYGEYGDDDVLLDLSILEMIHSLLAWIKIVHSVDLARI